MKSRTAAGMAGVAAIAIAAGIGGVALAQQKPPPLGAAPPPAVQPPPAARRPSPPAPQAGVPAGKPPPLGAPAAPPPTQAVPVPSPAPPPQVAQPPGTPPVKGGQPPAVVVPPQVAQPPAAPPPAAPPPAGEPAAVAQLRALLPPTTSLTYRTAETIDAARGSVRLLDVAIRPDANITTSIEELTFAGLREDGVTEATARNLSVQDRGTTKLTLARLQLGGIAVRRPPAGEQFMPDMIRADLIRVDGMRVTDQATVALEQLSLQDYGPGRPTRLAFSGLDVGLAPGSQVDRVGLARLALGGIDVATLFRALIEKTSPPRQLAGTQTLEIDEVSVANAGRPITRVASVRANGQADAQGSGGGALAVRGIRVESVPGLDDWLRRFGYSTLEMELTAESRYDAPSGRIDLTSLNLAGRDIGTLGLSLVIDGATQQAMEVMDLQGIRLVSMGLRYVDQSLYARFMRNHAQEMRAPEQQLREQYAAMAGGFLTAPGKGGLDQVRDAVQRFIRGQARQIEITARPPQPIPFAQMQGAPPGGPAEIQQMFGLSATAR